MNNIATDITLDIREKVLAIIDFYDFTDEEKNIIADWTETRVMRYAQYDQNDMINWNAIAAFRAKRAQKLMNGKYAYEQHLYEEFLKVFVTFARSIKEGDICASEETPENETLVDNNYDGYDGYYEYDGYDADDYGHDCNLEFYGKPKQPVLAKQNRLVRASLASAK